MSADARAIAKDIIQKVEDIRFRGGGPETSKLEERIDSLVRMTSQEAVQVARENGNRDQGAINSEVATRTNVDAATTQLKEYYRLMLQAHETARNERRQLAKIEHGQGWRRVLWRAASTASVAAVILLTWYLAHKWNIPLPLMRAPSPMAAGAG